jgi:xanthine dehydrogenase accessory factor
MEAAALLVVIQSASDIGSAVAHRLKRAGLHPIVLETPAPTATRRRMAFAGAMFTGEVRLEGLRGVRCAAPAAALLHRNERDAVPILAVPDFEPPSQWRLDVLVDARMRKKLQPAVQIHRAALVIGIGPGFQAGVHAHAVIESNWGERLGAVIWQGGTEEYTGKHREIEGFGRERYLYAPHAGSFHTRLDVGSPVRPGDPVGFVDRTPLVAQIGGALRGLAYDGVRVTEGTKLAEIDPTADPRNWSGIATRPGRIADGVLAAIRARWPDLE